MNSFRGAGGGKSDAGAQHVPVEAPDSLHSTAFAQVLDLVSEGEIQGLSDPDKPLTCIFLNETAVGNDDGSLNFKNLQVDWRYGTQTQDYIKSFDSTQNEIGVGVELNAANMLWTRTVTNMNLSALRVLLSTPGLSKADTSNGDINGYYIGYKIELSVDSGSFVTVLTSGFAGKTSTKYERSHRIDLPPAETSWTIRVTRTTAKSTSSAVQDIFVVESYTEIVDGKLRMPMSAVIGTIIDAQQFSNVPSRAFRLKGRIIRVPSNYDPDTRTYTGVWDGTFQSRYSNNPAWVFYDMVTHPRYGLGHLVPDSLVDKWSLYGIAKYCDELVSDGRGGTEPRFTANLYLQQQSDALRVLQDMSSMFRGIIYVAGGSITGVADMPSDPIYTYAPANVIDGKFTYQGSSRKVRHTVALISWNDMSDFGRAKIEYVEDPVGIARYGIQQTEAIAVGCTSQSQARRLGKYILTTERYETDLVGFSVGLDGTFPVPGKIIMIADPLRAGKRTGGRVSSFSEGNAGIIVDKMPDVAVGDKLTCIMTTGVAETRPVSGVIGNLISVSPSFSTSPAPQSVWLVESAELAAQKFRVIGVTENPDGIGYDISAIQHVEGKFDFIENDIAITEPPTTSGVLIAAPTEVTMTNATRVVDGGAINIITVDWKMVSGATQYGIKWRKDNGPWSAEIIKRDSTDQWEGALAGTYQAQIWAIDPRGFTSPIAAAGPLTVGEATLPVLDVSPEADGSLTLDCLYSQFRVNLNRNVTSVIFINVAPQDTIILQITQHGSYTISWPSSVQSISGQPYVVTLGDGAIDLVGLNTVNEGTLWLLTSQKPASGTGGGAALTITTPPTASNSVTTDGVTGSSPSVAVAATAAGGTTPLTYAWARTDTSGGTNFLISSTTASNPTFSVASATTAYNATQTWRCVVTDANGFTASDTTDIALTRTVVGSFGITIGGTTSGYCDSAGGGCTSSAHPVATPHNATGTVTYSWARVDTSGGITFSITGATTATPTIYKGPGSIAYDTTQVWRCTATCTAGTVHVDVSIELSRDNSSL